MCARATGAALRAAADGGDGGGHAAARKQFRRGWQAVPPDAFLAWAPSMLSLLDEDVGDALLPLLQVQHAMPCHCPSNEGICH